MQGPEGSPDHDWAELVLAVRRPAVDRAGDEKIVLRPIGEDRSEAERFALVEPIGAAKFLSMEAAEAKFAELACIAITLEVAVDNHGAQTFYERLGYEPTGRIRGYYADNTDALVMRKQLSVVG